MSTATNGLGGASVLTTPAPLAAFTSAATQHGNNTAPDVYRAINQISKVLSRDGISKGRRNEQQGYGFRGIDDVMNALSALLAGAELLILPRMSSRTQEERPTAKGGVLFYVTVCAEFDFVSVRDGSKHTVTMFGEAMDSADKATNKAMSAAYKYMALQVFCIPTEGMADADATTPTPQPKPKVSVMPQPAAQIIETLPEEETGSYSYDEEVPMELEEQLAVALEVERQKRLDAFAEMKRRYQAIGSVKTFYGVLGLNGAEKPSDFDDTERGILDAKKCYKELLADVRNRERRAQ